MQGIFTWECTSLSLGPVTLISCLQTLQRTNIQTQKNQMHGMKMQIGATLC